MLPQWISSSRTVQKLEVFKQRLWISLSLSGQQLEVTFLSQRIWWSLTGQKLEVFKLPQWKYFAFSFFHRRAAPARFAAIPTWRRRWAVGAFGARPDAYTLRLTEAALVPYNGLCLSYKRQGSVINACAQQGTVLQRHAPPQFLPIETRSLRVSRYGFM